LPLGTLCFANQLDALQAAIGRQDVAAALALLERLVPEWQRGGDFGASQVPEPVVSVEA
jgi:hypothetical protein